MSAKLKLKPLADQTIVVTGSTSGHGLCTAQMAAKAGATVMLAARDEEALQRVVSEIKQKGGKADYVVTDVSQPEQVEHLAEETIRRFGGFDTWVNNAGTGVYAQLEKLSLEDHRAIFDTNYWGVVHGSMAALRHLKNKPHGGALITVGSINGDMAAPILGSYNASKHAVKGFIDSLRIETMMNKQPVSVTLIKPSAIGTPFPQHARNQTGSRASLPPPIYAPDVTARAILYAAQHRRRAITVGGGGKFQVLGATILPSLYDRIAVTMAGALVDKERPIGDKEGDLYEPHGKQGRTEGHEHGRHFSTFTAAGRHPFAMVGAVAAVAAGGIWAATRGSARA